MPLAWDGSKIWRLRHVHCGGVSLITGKGPCSCNVNNMSVFPYPQATVRYDFFWFFCLFLEFPSMGRMFHLEAPSFLAKHLLPSPATREGDNCFATITRMRRFVNRWRRITRIHGARKASPSSNIILVSSDRPLPATPSFESRGGLPFVMYAFGREGCLLKFCRTNQMHSADKVGEERALR